jgi:hypothetical protein
MRVVNRLFWGATMASGITAGIACLLFLMVTEMSHAPLRDGLAVAIIFLVFAIPLSFYRLPLILRRPLLERFASELPSTELPPPIISPRIMLFFVAGALLCLVPGLLLIRNDNISWWWYVLPWVGMLLALLGVKSLQKRVILRQSFRNKESPSTIDALETKQSKFPNLLMFFLAPFAVVGAFVAASLAFGNLMHNSFWFRFSVLAVILWTFWFLRSRMIRRHLTASMRGGEQECRSKGSSKDASISVERAFIPFLVMLSTLMIGSLVLFAGVYSSIAFGKPLYAILAVTVYVLSLYLGRLESRRAVVGFGLSEQ